MSNDWSSPKAVGTFIVTIGILPCLVVYLLLVQAGVVATPLMEGIRLMPQVYAQHTVMMEKISDMTSLFNRILALEKAQCDNNADNKEELQRCNNAYAPVFPQ